MAADLYTDFPERFEQRTRVYLLDNTGNRRELAIEQHWLHKGRVVLKFAGVDSITDAEQLTGCEVQVPAADRAPLERDAVYISELIGCRVLDDGRDIGEVTDLSFEAGEAPLLLVREGKREHLIPFAQEYLKSLDTAGKQIQMQLPEGLLELDAPLSDEEKQRQHSKD